MMKMLTAAAAIALAPTLALAGGTIATLPNESGGRIELTDVAITDRAILKKIPECERSLLAKAWSRALPDMFGCWTISGDTILIYWIQAQQNRTYLQTDFLFTPYARALMENEAK